MLEFRADLDDVEALSPEREAPWARIDKATFLTLAEKRAAAGYGADGAGTGIKYSPDQPRVPRGKPGGGQWTSEDEGEEDDPLPDALAKPYGVAPDGTPIDPAASRPRGGPPKGPSPPPATPPKAGDAQPQYKTPKSGQSGKEASKDVPSWARGERPLVGENGDAFAKRLLDKQYGDRKHEVGPGSEFSKIKKYGDRDFE